MNILRAENRKSEQGRADYFTGKVMLEPLAALAAPARLRAFRVTFEARSRTAWHTHPLGQVLHILSGTARVQRAGGKIETLNVGDTVTFWPGERHWHGAAPDGPMIHLAVQEADETGSHATWFELVSDAEYGGGQ